MVRKLLTAKFLTKSMKIIPCFEENWELDRKPWDENICRFQKKWLFFLLREVEIPGWLWIWDSQHFLERELKLQKIGIILKHTGATLEWQREPQNLSTNGKDGRPHAQLSARIPDQLEWWMCLQLHGRQQTMNQWKNQNNHWISLRIKWWPRTLWHLVNA